MDSIWLCSFLLTVITGHTLAAITAIPVIPVTPVTPVTEESYKQAVLPAFVEGLNSLASVADTLQSSTDLRQCIQKVHQLLASSHKSLSKAEQSSLAQVETLSRNVEQRVDMIRRLNDEQRSLENQQQRLNVQLYGLNSQQYLARRQLYAAERALDNANDDLNRAYKRRREAEKEKDVAKGIMFIPVFGPLIGGVLLPKAEEAVRNAQRAVNGASHSVSIQRYNVNQYESGLRSTRAEIYSTERNIVDHAAQIKFIQHLISEEKALQQTVMNFFIPLRKCTSFLGTFAGKTRVTSVLKDLIATLDGLLEVLNEIVVALRPLIERSSDYQLLITASLPTTIAKLEEANRRIKLAVDSENSELQDFI